MSPFGVLQFVVLDEADELVRSNSVPFVAHIVKTASRLTHRPSVVAVSATSSPSLTKFIDEHLRARSIGKASAVWRGSIQCCGVHQ
jgi:superfamily II DNA/RNA helicase